MSKFVLTLFDHVNGAISPGKRRTWLPGDATMGLCPLALDGPLGRFGLR
ncbi:MULTISPECIES: hypothetical protein [Frankia]|nr:MULTISPECIES: hypothetical protein [Frankia]